MHFEFKEDSADSIIGIVTRSAPCLFVEHLELLIADTLSKHLVANTRYKHLYIPGNEIWITVGGDKGQG